MQRKILVISACLCAFSNSIAAEASLQQGSDPNAAGHGPSDEPLKPAVLKFDVSKRGVFVRSCYGGHFSSTKPFSKKFWLLPAECLNNTKYDAVAVKHGYKDNSRAKLHLNKDLFYELHPNYDEATKANNIALVRLPSYLSLELRTDYKSIELPSTNDSFSIGRTLQLYEYASVTNQHDGKEDALLLSIKTKRINSIWCQILYPFSPSGKDFVCASGLFNKGLSQNYFGSPLVTQDGESFKLVGLTPILRPWACRFLFPMEFLSVQPYLDWINTRIQRKHYQN